MNERNDHVLTDQHDGDLEPSCNGLWCLHIPVHPFAHVPPWATLEEAERRLERKVLTFPFSFRVQGSMLTHHRGITEWRGVVGTLRAGGGGTAPAATGRHTQAVYQTVRCPLAPHPPGGNRTMAAPLLSSPLRGTWDRFRGFGLTSTNHFPDLMSGRLGETLWYHG